MSGPGLALGAAAVWGASDFCGGLVTRRASSALIVMIAHGLGLLLLLLALAAFHPAVPQQQTVIYGLLAGLAGGVGLLFLYQGLSLGSMGLVAALSGVLTAVVPVVASLFSYGRPTVFQFAGFAVAIAAIWLIAYAPSAEVHPHGLGFGAASGVCFGFLLYFLHLGGKGGLLWALTFSRIGSVACAVAFGIYIAWRGNTPLRSPGVRWMNILPLATAAGLLDISGNLLYTASSLAGRLDVAAILSSLYPAGTILLAIWLLKERATRSQKAGMALALLAVAMISA
jgi:drug/metabolite transporter (DMT)-like permease